MNWLILVLQALPTIIKSAQDIQGMLGYERRDHVEKIVKSIAPEIENPGPLIDATVATMKTHGLLPTSENSITLNKN